jgi:hypothetical protein
MSPSDRNQLASIGVSADAVNEASRIAASFAALLSGLPSPQTAAIVQFILAETFQQTKGFNPGEYPMVDPRIIEWSIRTFDAQEAAANLREIRETGGLSLADFYSDLEQLARG